jgi:hypothetical protein
MYVHAIKIVESITRIRPIHVSALYIDRYTYYT